jgi:ABC-2 type transport system ATP-binding protein
MEAIRTEGLTKHYRVGFWRPRPYVALDALTLEVHQGEVFGFLGPNGAGKTTTLKLLMQLVYPTLGRAEILGRPVGDVEVRRRIGYLPENPYFYDYLTAEELLEYFASLFGYRGADRRRRVERLLDAVGIGAERRLQLRKFSKGMLQRVGIAQAILNEPQVVFFDEPMSGLDPLGRRVAILAGGRLAAVGQLADLVAFEIRGWELVVAGLTAAALEHARSLGQVVRATPLGEGRYALELPLSAAPDQVLSNLTARGARLISLNPVRETLEDYFIRQVGGAPRERGLETA